MLGILSISVSTLYEELLNDLSVKLSNTASNDTISKEFVDLTALQGVLLAVINDSCRVLTCRRGTIRIATGCSSRHV